MVVKKVVLMVAAAMLMVTAEASVKDAHRFFEAGKYPEAIKEYERYAKTGDLESQYLLAAMHYSGKGVVQNKSLAFSWWALAASQQYKDSAQFVQTLKKEMSDAENKLAIAQFESIYEKYNPAILKASLYPEIIKENLDKKIVFSDAYQEIEGLEYGADAELESSVEEGEDAFLSMLERKSSAPNIRTSAYMLQADFTVAPDGSVRDYEPVFRYGRTEYGAGKVKELKFKPATFDGNPVSYDIRKGFGMLHEDSPMLSRFALHEDHTRLYQALIKSKNLSKTDSPMGNYLYACSLMLFEGVKTDREKIDQLLLSAAEAGIDEAQFVLGTKWYREQINIEQAIFWIHAAAKQGLSNAELRLGKILLESPWVKHDEAKATFWLNRAAKQGDINGLRKMAWIRLFSETPDIVNVNEAFKNLEPLKVADPENPEVHYILAWAYHKSNQKPLAIGALEKAIGLGKAKRWDVKEWESDLVSWKSNTSVTIEEVPQKP